MKTMLKLAVMMVAATGLMRCAVMTPPKVLVDARSAYDRAAGSQVASLTPNELNDARKALDVANAQFDKHGDTAETRDYSYVAMRKIEIAESKARFETDRRAVAQLSKEAAMLRDLKQTAALNRQLQEARAELQSQGKGRIAAEAESEDLRKQLMHISEVKEDERGLVITLSSALTFPVGKATLSNAAERQLDQVATLLKSSKAAAGRKVTIEGHTDSTGSKELNQRLSVNRAEAVRNFLVSAGVPEDRIETMGMGEDKPLVENDTVAHRAINRRVEIIIRGIPVS